MKKMNHKDLYSYYMFFKITSFLQLKERSYLCFVYIDII